MIWSLNSYKVLGEPTREALLNGPDESSMWEPFSWDTFSVYIESRAHECLANSGIGWFGDGSGMNAYPTFLLLKGTKGVTSHGRSCKGPGAVEVGKKEPSPMPEGHDPWLRTLKQRPEQQFEVQEFSILRFVLP